MLKQRIQSGLLIIAALLAASWWLPPAGALVVLLVVCAATQWEFYRLLDAAQIPHFKFYGLVGGLALVAATWWSCGTTYDADWAVLYAITAIVFLRQFPQKHTPQPLVTIAGTLLGVMYVPFLFNFFTRLLRAWGDPQGRLLVIYLVLVVKSTDVGAFFIGCGIGRHKLIPRISPAKTWEGCIGGALTGVLASVLFYLFSRGDLGPVRMSLGDSLILGVLLATAGTVGDLTESLFKRASGVKDSGRIVLGMGGLLDVLDSLLFAAPALYIYARFFLEATH
jgi:phosphatidate cytidylyltransferase